MTSRWWTYQKERFPVFAHGPLILAFSMSAMSYSALLRGETALRPAAALVAFVTAFLFSFSYASPTNLRMRRTMLAGVLTVPCRVDW